MTKEEKEKIIEILDSMKVKIAVPKSAVMQNQKNWALDKAIKLIETQPCEDAVTRAVQGRRKRMKRKPKKTDFRQGFEPWMNNKRKNKAYKKQQQADAMARFLEKCMRHGYPYL